VAVDAKWQALGNITVSSPNFRNAGRNSLPLKTDNTLTSFTRSLACLVRKIKYFNAEQVPNCCNSDTLSVLLKK
jgi:hypothetical protein